MSRGEKSVLLEPRVMQVLIVLAEGGGAVISRDELIERCWGGRIVGENAINRVISHIRQTAAELGLESVKLETITKVGYRLATEAEEDGRASAPTPLPWPVDQGDPRERSPEPSGASVADGRPFLTRRQYALGLAIAASGLGAAGYWFWPGKRRPRPHPDAAELHRRGQIAQKQGSPEQTRQAVSFLRRATEIDPLYAEAWGGLALAYRHILEGYGNGEQGGIPALIESAARRALDLDPDNADAAVALAIIRPMYRNWGPIEADLLRIERAHPDHWFLQAQLGIVRYETGRWRDGLPHTEQQLQVEPLIPIPHVMHGRALWSLGRLQEAETVLDAAVSRWPGNFLPWSLKFNFLLFTGRPAAAAAFVLDPDVRPEHLRPEGVEARVVLARAVERRQAPDIEASLADQKMISADPGSATMTAPVFGLLGRPDLALAVLERYFFGAPAGELGPAAEAPGTFDRRHTSPLFMPPMAPLWNDARFAALLERTGLSTYWRETGTSPDYRRASGEVGRSR